MPVGNVPPPIRTTGTGSSTPPVQSPGTPVVVGNPSGTPGGPGRTVLTEPNDPTPVVVSGGGGVRTGGIRTGGYKPPRGNGDVPPTGGEPDEPTAQPTGNGGNGGNGTLGQAPVRTGGYKPPRGEAGNGASEENVTIRTGRVRGNDNPAGGNLAVAATKEFPALLFAKMPCRGTCPSYTATVWPNGRVLYVGQQNVPRIGSFELMLPAATVAAMQEQAQQAGFSELQESYASGATDIPATMLTMYGRDGSAKTVSVEDAAPAQVQALFSYIDGELGRAAGGGEQAAPTGEK